MRCRAESGDYIEAQSHGESTHGNTVFCDVSGFRQGECEGYGAQADSHAYLHGDCPPALGADDVDNRAPEGFDHPRQVEPAGVECRVGFRHAQLGEQHHSDHIDEYERDTLREVQRGNPRPRIHFCTRFHMIVVSRFRKAGISKALSGLSRHSSVPESGGSCSLGRPSLRRRSGTDPRRVPSRLRGGGSFRARRRHRARALPPRRRNCRDAMWKGCGGFPAPCRWSWCVWCLLCGGGPDGRRCRGG